MPKFPDPARSRVVLIGTSDYERADELSNLPAVRGNLSGLEAALTNTDSGVFAFASCTVVDSPDSPGSLMRRLSRAAGEAEDVLLVYYAGHGVLGWNGDLHLSVRQTDQHQVSGTAVPFDWVRHTIQDSPAAVRILILDCCFSGRAVGAMSSDSAALEQINVAGTYILTSTEANKISHAIPGERYTAFTAELIKLLASDETPSDDVLTLETLYPRLRAAMSRRGLPQPKAVLGDSSGGIILRRTPLRPETPSLPVTTIGPVAPAINVALTPNPADIAPPPVGTTQQNLPARPESIEIPQPPMSPPSNGTAPTSANDRTRIVLQLTVLIVVWIIFVSLFVFSLTGLIVTATGGSSNNVVGAAISLPILVGGTFSCALFLRKLHRSRRAARQNRASFTSQLGNNC
jgi:Caspase domain